MKRRQLLRASAAAIIASSLPRISQATPAAPLHAPKAGPINVVFVVGKGAVVIDFAGPWEVFQDASTRGNDSPFSLAMISDQAAPIEATDGMIITPSYTYRTLTTQPNVVVMGAQGEHTPDKIAWIREASANADVVMSVCTGAFLLAKTGLLDGLSATTHHDYYDQFEQRFPAVHLVRGPRYVENEKLCSSGGLTSGIELALRVVERYFGSPVADHTAYYMEYNRSPNRPTA